MTNQLGNYQDYLWWQRNGSRIQDWEEAKSTFLKHFCSSASVARKRTELRVFKREQNESIQSFSDRFLNLAASVNYHTNTDDAVYFFCKA